MTHLEVTLPLRLVNPLNNRKHWRVIARVAKTNRGCTRMAFAARAKDIRLPCVVTITRISAGELDSDNLAASAKPTRDGFADAMGIDDRDPRITWQYAQAKGPRGKYAVCFRIEW